MNAPDVLSLFGVIILPILEAQIIIRVYGSRGYRPGATIAILHLGMGTILLTIAGTMANKYAEAPLTCPYVVTAVWVAITGAILAAFSFMHFALYSFDFIRRIRRV